MPRKQLLYLMITFFALFVVMLGAYTRLSDSGLGCPDWPGCYGQLTVANTHTSIIDANSLYPNSPIQQVKAWPEMIHRYLAGTLGILIIGISIYRLNRIRQRFEDLSLIPLLLISMVMMQALLGKWTVSWLLHPLAVMPHLIGGMMITTMLYWQYLCHSNRPAYSHIDQTTRWMMVLTSVLLIMQIAMGGWTSSQYAALSCPDFPTCQGNLWPTMNFTEAFSLFLPSSATFEGGVLSQAGKTAIHMAHRILAGILTLSILMLLKRIYRLYQTFFFQHAGLILCLLLGQLTLGISNVMLQLPILVATAHNGLGCLLLLAMTAMIYDAKHSSAISQDKQI
tara:strand:+ start:1919 stop:2932 length:1014 start_codon:yes stop_codon:yes gene_type:complete